MARLTVKNVGPIREADFEVKKYTVFIGPQGSGKSTLAKLIAIGGDHLAFKAEVENDIWSRYSLGSFLTPASSFSYKSDLYELSYSIDHGIKLNSEQDNLFKFLKQKWIDINRQLLTASDGKEANVDLNQLWQEAEESELRLSDFLSKLIYASSVYVPSERIFISMLSKILWSNTAQSVSIPEQVKLFGNRFEIASQKIKEISIPFLSISFQNNAGVKQLVHGNDKINPIPLLYSASGYQSLIPIILTVEDLRSFVIRRFIIEEPELNLYPTAQKDLIYNLVSGLDPEKTYQDAEWVFTTHSPYVLSSLNTLMLAYKVAQQSEENRAKVEAIIPARHWINPDDFTAYYVDEGTVRSIINPKTGLISDNELDDVSDALADEQQALLDIRRLTAHHA